MKNIEIVKKMMIKIEKQETFINKLKNIVKLFTLYMVLLDE